MRNPSFLKINPEVLIKAVILLSYSALFIVLVVTKRIGDYLHPRLIPYLIFAAMAFLLMTYSLLQDFNRPRRRFSAVPYLIFLLPLILAATVPAKAAGGSPAQLGGTGIVGMPSGLTAVPAAPTDAAQPSPDSGVSSTGGGDPSPDSGADGLQLQPNQQAVYSKTPFGASVVLIFTDNTIVADDKNFVSWLSELDGNPEKYAGMKIEYVGYVYKSDEFGSDEFVAGRDMMWCCAADVQMIGCLCRYDKTSELQASDWVKVSGTLGTAVWRDAVIPVITDTEVTPVPAPDEAYVYPQY